jgi:hypothetical protein
MTASEANDILSKAWATYRILKTSFFSSGYVVGRSGSG